MKKFLYIKNNNSIKFLSKKKIIKKKLIINNNIFSKFLNNFRIIYLYNLLIEYFLFDFFLLKYNIIKNIWYLFLIYYKIFYNKLKINIIYFYNKFIIKYFIINLLSLRKLKFYFRKNINIDYFFKDKTLIFLKVLYNLIKQKNKLKINTPISRLFKYKMNKIRLKLPLFFFNNYKKKKYFAFVSYFIKLLNLNIKFKKEFILYWKRFYIYLLKHYFINIYYILKKYIYILSEQLKKFCSLINLKKKKNKNLFYFFFFYNIDKYRLLKRGKISSYLKKINKLLNFNFYKKILYNIYIFFYKKKCIYHKNNNFKYYLKILNIQIKIKFLTIFKNFIFIFFLQFLNFLINYNLLKSLQSLNFLINYDGKLNLFYKDLIFIKERKKKEMGIINCEFFFHNNIIKK